MTKSMMRLLSLAAAAAALSGCVIAAPTAAPDANLPVNPSVGAAEITPAIASAGLQERQPDLCGAKTYIPYLGQPGSMVPGLGITKPYRVVEFRGIEPQEYNPQRIVFRLDAAGNIQNIDCG